MNEPQTILCDWDGEVMRPASPLWAKRADAQWVVGERYQVDIRQERSDASHRAYFAAINECWQNLPEDKQAQYPTSEHLRKWALVKAGYRDERSIVCVSPSEARRIAAFIMPIDDYAVVLASDAVVKVYTAKSQSYRAMGKAEFQKSKDAVLDVLAKLLGVSVDDLKKADAA